MSWGDCHSKSLEKFNNEILSHKDKMIIELTQSIAFLRELNDQERLNNSCEYEQQLKRQKKIHDVYNQHINKQKEIISDQDQQLEQQKETISEQDQLIKHLLEQLDMNNKSGLSRLISHII